MASKYLGTYGTRRCAGSTGILAQADQAGGCNVALACFDAKPYTSKRGFVALGTSGEQVTVAKAVTKEKGL